MTDSLDSLLGTVRNPEYTGSNRCTPCTIINVVIAGVVAGLAATQAVELGLFVFVVALLVIYVRGYLVPGTPTLTKRYLPDRILAYFDDGPSYTDPEEKSWDAIEERKELREHAVDPVEFLTSAGVVEPCADRDDLCFTAKFERRLADNVARRRDDEVAVDIVADMFQTDPTEVSPVDRDYPAFSVGRFIRKWPSQTALVADVTAHDALVEHTERWLEVPIQQRVGILKSLRSFLETCPDCGGEITMGESIVESCCATHDVVVLACGRCEGRLLEFDPTQTEGVENPMG